MVQFRLEQKIIGMYGHGMSLRDISAHIKDMYDTDISAATLSAFTEVIPLVTEWQSRPLDPLYCIVWLGAMYYKLKQDSKIITRFVSNILALLPQEEKKFQAAIPMKRRWPTFS